MMDEHFWDDYAKAQKIVAVLNENRSIRDGYEHLKTGFESLIQDLEMLGEEEDPELQQMVEEEFLAIMKEYEGFEMKVLMDGEYDHCNAIVEIHPGAGGTEAQDWAEMLYRMYARWAAAEGLKLEADDIEDGDEAGLKSVTFTVSGTNAYGMLKSESGVHRLVRISPFDANNRRHTSFASVGVLPEIENSTEIEIDPKDLEIETHRASGAGGQHINKTDSAVRIIHKPTGIVATSQSQRSQIQNREQAMNILRSRLFAIKQKEDAAKKKEIQGEVMANEWGSQIRSYVMCPYTLVKDNRSGYETANVDGVLNGDLEGFIYAYLKFLASKK